MLSPVNARRSSLPNSQGRGSQGPADTDGSNLPSAIPKRSFFNKDKVKCNSMNHTPELIRNPLAVLPDITEGGATNYCKSDRRSSLNTHQPNSPISDRRSSLVIDWKHSPLSNRRNSLKTDWKSSPKGNRRSSLKTDWKPSPNFNRRSSLKTDWKQSPQLNRRFSLKTDYKSSPSIVRRSSLVTDRRSSLVTDYRYPLVTDRRSSLVSDRRSSLISNQTPSLVTDRRSSLVTDRRSSLVTDHIPPGKADRRHSLSSDSGTTMEPHRRYTLICVPKEIHQVCKLNRTTDKDDEEAAIEAEIMRICANTDDKYWLAQADPAPKSPKISVTTKKLAELSLAKTKDNQSNIMASIEDECMKLTTYRPKPCWCLRCQMMLSMFNLKDDKLTEWGTYPCFRR